MIRASHGSVPVTALSSAPREPFVPPALARDGSYTGTYEGRYGDSYRTFPISDAVEFTVSKSQLEVTKPASGTGTVSEDGTISFSSELQIADGPTVTYRGRLTPSGASVEGSGDWDARGSTYTGRGTWRALRRNR